MTWTASNSLLNIPNFESPEEPASNKFGQRYDVSLQTPGVVAGGDIWGWVFELRHFRGHVLVFHNRESNSRKCSSIW